MTEGVPPKVAGSADGSFEKWREAGFDRNSVLADPLFVDPARGDYNLRPESPALKLGFKPIPFETIGYLTQRPSAVRRNATWANPVPLTYTQRQSRRPGSSNRMPLRAVRRFDAFASYSTFYCRN